VAGVLAFRVWWFGWAGAGAACCVASLAGRVVGGVGACVLASTGAGHMCNPGASEPRQHSLLVLIDVACI
jgi:hypothetical protein